MNSRTVRRPSRSRSPRSRSWVSYVEGLEVRQVLSTLPVAQPMFQLGPMGINPSPPAGAFTPAQISQAYQYGLLGSGGTGAGQTIAIVDAYNDPNIQSDLNAFDAQFGLAATTITKVNQSGGTSYPAADSTGGWALETSLDVEWAHAMAPKATILLVEANSANDSDLLSAVSYAAAHANVVSMSWGGGEFSGQSSYDSYFSHPGVAFVASSGDAGAPISWPAASPNVLAVGGTTLSVNGGGAWAGETGWSGSGGGPSAYEAQPSYQAGVVTTTTMRANPDVAYNASPSTGYAVYDSVPYSGTTYGWLQVGGTSAGAPQWAAILAIADQGRAAAGQPALNSAGPQEVMTTLYKNPADFHDITTGTSTGSPNYSAGPGYDYVTGIGSPMVNLVVGSLDPASSTTSPDTLAVSAPAASTAGNTMSITVAADKAGTTTADTGFTGTIQLTSTDAQAVLPASYTFTASDKGVHTFTVTLKTAGTQHVTATDTSTSATVGTSSAISVSPAAASRFVLTGLSSSATAGVAQGFTLTAWDPYGNVATGYTGTVHFTSSDAAASLPANYTFTATAAGTHAFSVTFKTAGTQSLTVADATAGLSATQSGINVSPAAPIHLTATVVSSSQINLSWTASTGDTGYQIQRSTSPTSGWTVIGTTAAGTTTYQDKTGLAAGTTYYFRVIATGAGGSLTSAASNTASATTTGGTTTSTTDSIWGNAYTPSVNAYAWGWYELGMKFQSSVAGQVTGVRFYEQSWMSGFVHVGHLWSSSGTLLASATFANGTSAGWQQVNFSGAVTIQPNTTYIVSFSTGGGYFGIDTNYFSNSGVTNGPLTAPSDSQAGGNGVYQSAGYFPNVSGAGMNFWVDVAFSPTSGAAVKTAGPIAPPKGYGGHTTGHSGFFIATPPSTTPAGPVGLSSGSKGVSAVQQPTNASGVVTFRGVVRQGRSPIRWAPKGPAHPV